MYSTVAFGPAATTWYGFLQRRVAFKSAASTVTARVIADQLLFTPVHLTAFLSSMAFLEGTDPAERLRATLVPSYKANLAIWPAVQAVNFSIIPLDYRVLFVNVVALGRSLSINHRQRYFESRLTGLQGGIAY